MHVNLKTYKQKNVSMAFAKPQHGYGALNCTKSEFRALKFVEVVTVSHQT